MQPEQQRVMGYFIEEAKEHLNTIEQSLLNLQSVIEEPEMLNEVFRAAHSVKGGAAMLGLYSIQQTAHSLEDYFKVLKEHPVKVDQKLESLLFRSFDTLQGLLEELQGPFGLTDDVADNATKEFELVSVELKTHLATLVSQVSKATFTDGPGSTEPKIGTPLKPEGSTIVLVFQNDIPTKLREMLQLFKQADNPASRQQLQKICQSLAQVGRQFDLPTWSELTEIARLAIASLENSYAVLAPTLIKEIKAARDLVLAGHSATISPSQQLKALVPQKSNLAPAELGHQRATPAEAGTQPSTASSAGIHIGGKSFQDIAESGQAGMRRNSVSETISLRPVVPDSGVAPSAPLTSSPTTGPELGMTDSHSSADLSEEAPDLQPHLAAEVVDDSNGVTPTSNSVDVEASSQELSELFEVETLPDDASASAHETDFASLFDSKLTDDEAQEDGEVKAFLPFSLDEAEIKSSQTFQVSSEPLQTSESSEAVADLKAFNEVAPSAEGGSVAPVPASSNSRSQEFVGEPADQPDASEALEPPLKNLDTSSLESAEPRLRD